jgi:hypothetical protein
MLAKEQGAALMHFAAEMDAQECPESTKQMNLEPTTELLALPESKKAFKPGGSSQLAWRAKEREE